MMLSGEYVTLNSHFEDWNLPKWYHPTTTLNMTTVNRLNELAQQARIGGMDKRQETELASAIVNATNASTSTSSQTYDTSTSSTTVVSPPTPVVVKPRFPENHPISKELFELEKAAAIIHFSAFGKPWTVTDEMLRAQRPDAHPLLGEQFRLWRTTAAMVCPGMAEALE